MADRTLPAPRRRHRRVTVGGWPVQFHVIFTEPTGGATFSLECDGGPERAIATVVIKGCEHACMQAHGIACNLRLPTCHVSCRYNAGLCDSVPASCEEVGLRLGFNRDEALVSLSEWSHQFEEVYIWSEPDHSQSAPPLPVSTHWLP